MFVLVTAQLVQALKGLLVVRSTTKTCVVQDQLFLNAAKWQYLQLDAVQARTLVKITIILHQHPHPHHTIVRIFALVTRNLHIRHGSC